MEKKKSNRRTKTKHPNLKPEFNLKSRTELIEADYLHKLSEAELDWLDCFNKEYVNAGFNKDNKKNLHKTKKQKKDCYDRNNARNRDVLTRAKASGKFHYIDDITGSNDEEELRRGYEQDNQNNEE
jgi:hypothetical protein